MLLASLSFSLKISQCILSCHPCLLPVTAYPCLQTVRHIGRHTPPAAYDMSKFTICIMPEESYNYKRLVAEGVGFKRLCTSFEAAHHEIWP